GEYSTGRKGLPLLIEALKGEPLALIVVKGPGPRARVEADLARRGMAQRVMFIEPGLGVASVMAAADVVVVPSTYEPFSLVALEAISSGRPLVISSRAGATELVSSVAKVVDPLDTEALRTAIMEVKNHPPDRMLIEEGIAIAERNSWTTVGERSVDVIERLASEHRVGR
ncbi:MAG TPA: glycosyltransferase, partial [Actinomycetota bacterium]|nr:glycosyltransferase [Actinomycetota bacterium]